MAGTQALKLERPGSSTHSRAMNQQDGFGGTSSRLARCEIGGLGSFLSDVPAPAARWVEPA
jgi:hypothetical protein